MKCEKCNAEKGCIPCPDGQPGCEVLHGLACINCEPEVFAGQPGFKDKGYTINFATMLFENISNELYAEMLTWAEEVVLKGSVPSPDPDWVSDYLATFGYDNPRQRLLFISTAMPQRVLLSLVKSA